MSTSPHAPRVHRTRTSSRWLPRLVVSLLLLAGAWLMLQPVAATVAADRETRQQSESYDRAVGTVPPARRDLALSAADAYNAHLSPTALADPWTSGTSARADAAHAGYAAQLADLDAMARLRIPAVAVDLPVVHDATEASLLRGVGHLYGSSLPVGGPGTHTVLAGHTAWPGQTFFDRLPELVAGDTVQVDVYGQALTYRVERTAVVAADDFSQLRPVAGQDLLTLVTCVVDGHDLSRRLLVHAVRVPGTAGPAAGGPGSTGTTTVSDTTSPSRTAAVTTVPRWAWPRVAGGVGAVGLLAAMALSWWVSDLRARRKDHA